MIEQIIFKKEIYAIIIRRKYKNNGIKFLHQINFPSNLPI